MIHWCSCCGTCQPRYRRLVDSIYPSVPESGLVKSNMQKLTFYAVSHPEKLDRIGAYLTHRLGRDIYRQRQGFIRVAVEAMNQLLAACRMSPSLNLYVESFLKMVHRLLETALPELELMATESFVNFANTEEDAPSYHRRYDFFISKFSSLCHNGAADLNIRQKLRVAGIKGLRGVVRKTATDDLQANIWEKQHMDKIVPSLLFNIHDSFSVGCAAGGVEGPCSLAMSCLRELIGKASFGNIKCVLSPTLNHFDHHHLWTTTPFATSSFEAIMDSVQSQYSYVVIQSLIGHLDRHANDSTEVRCGIATVLSRIVVVAASASIGPSLLEIFNSMLRHLRQSVEMQSHDDEKHVSDKSNSERAYQDILINTFGSFADNLPDYQKTEIMVFIMSKVPLDAGCRLTDKFLQNVLTRTLLQVATKYRTCYLGTVLTSTFLEPLLKLALAEDARVRLLVQQILQTLVDRHQNLQSLTKLTATSGSMLNDFNPSAFTAEKFSRADTMFVQKFGDSLLLTLYESAMMANNEQQNYDSIFITISLLFLEIGCESVILDLFRLALALQESALDEGFHVSVHNKNQLKQLVSRYVLFASSFLSIPLLGQRCQRLLRECEAENNMPDAKMQCKAGFPIASDEVFVIEPEAADLLVDQDDTDHRTGEAPWLDKQELAESLKLRDYDVARLNQPFMPSKAESVKLSTGSTGTRSSYSTEIDSVDSSDSRPLRKLSRRTDAVLEHDGVVFPSNVDGLRQLLARATDTWAQKEEERCLKTVKMFQTLPFSSLIEIQRQNRSHLYATVERLFKESPLSKEKPASPPVVNNDSIFRFEFPQLFVH